MSDEFGKIIDEPTPDAAGENLTPYLCNARYAKPTELRHELRDPRTLDTVRRTGLDPQAASWDLSKYIPQRPAGVFFFAANEMPHWGQIAVNVSDLDTSRLFAFPSEIAVLASQLQSFGDRLDEQTRIIADLYCTSAPVVAYADYDGSFVAEWIYVGKIHADNLQWHFNR